jgi:hypothetical protein
MKRNGRRIFPSMVRTGHTISTEDSSWREDYSPTINLLRWTKTSHWPKRPLRIWRKHQHGNKRNHVNLFVEFRAIQLRGKWKVCMTSFWMAWGILWNKWRHVKWDSNKPKMELDWARNQPQETRGIELGRIKGGEDTCKNKNNLASLGNEASRRVSTLDMPQKAT